MSDLDKQAEELRETIDEYHLAYQYLKEQRERTEQARERCSALSAKVEDMRNKFMLEAVGKERMKHNHLMFG